MTIESNITIKPITKSNSTDVDAIIDKSSAQAFTPVKITDSLTQCRIPSIKNYAHKHAKGKVEITLI